MRTPSLQSGPVASNLLRRFGFAGFLFFLVKGLLWLGLPALMAVMLGLLRLVRMALGR